MASKGRVACVMANDFEDSEFAKPAKAIEDAGFELEVISTEKPGTTLKGKQGKETAKVHKSVDQADPNDYVALFIPGGHSPDNLRRDEKAVAFVKAFDDAHKQIFAICHAPQLFMAARIVKGRRLTAWKTIQRDLELIPDVEVVDEPVVRDGNWITSRQPDDIPAFSNAVTKALEAAGERAQAPITTH